MKKDSAIIYESIYKTIELIPDTELKWEAIKGILKYSFYGEELNSDNPLVQMVYTSAFPSIRNAVERYERAVEDGKRGGRPSTVDKEKVLQLKKQGKTYQEISDELDCPKNTIKKILQREGTKGTKGTNEVCTPPEKIEGTKGTNLKGYYPIENEEIDGVQRVQTLKVCPPENTQNEGWGTKGTNLSVSVSVSDSVSASDTDTESVSVCFVPPEVGYKTPTASPNNATGVAQQQQTTTLSNLIKYKIREMWKPGVKQSDVVKSIKSEFNIDLTFADVNEIWDKYRNFEEKEKLRELAEKEKSELTKQVKISAKDKKHYNETGRAIEIIKELNLNSISEISITEKEIIDWYNDAYEKAKTQPKYKYDFTMDQMIKFISDEALTVDNIQELKNAWCKKINLERGWTWS